MSSLDELLSSSIKSAAEPAASAGVADAIRSRVAAGDAGTSVAGSTAPGWGGSAGGIMTIVAPIALIVVAGVVGGALGASGLLGGSSAPAGGDIPAYVLSAETAAIYSCPGGPQIGAIPAETRVLAVARDADGVFLGARNPDDVASTIWFATGDLILDDDSADPATLPVEECPDVTVTQVTPTPTPEPTETAPPKPPAETTPPSITSIKASKTVVLNNESSTISVAATDNVGVTTVTLSWTNGTNSGSATMPKSGSSWQYVWANNGPPSTYGVYKFTAVAFDAAGNQSPGAEVLVDQQYFG
ncbi:MAG: hypothetical protein ABIQ01_01330 [Pseudolysinimonas sp.]